MVTIYKNYIGEVEAFEISQSKGGGEDDDA